MAYFKSDELMNRQIILDHYDNPTYKVDQVCDLLHYHHFNAQSSGCIDNLTIYLKIENNTIKDGKFFGVGCAISTAATDILIELILQKDCKTILKIIEQYDLMVNGLQYDSLILDQLVIFKNIHKQLNRIKCAKIGSDAMKMILLNYLQSN